MDKKVIKIWANKNNRHNWLAHANDIDCRNRKGYELIGYIGYNVKETGKYVAFSADDVFGKTNHFLVLAINVDSIS